MSTKEPGASSPPIESYADLVGWIAAGEKPPAQWRIGTEHEKFVFRASDHAPVPYDGPDGIGALMQALIEEFGWQAIKEGDTTIALKRSDGGGVPETISLEPGGQFELSGAPLATLHETCAEAGEHLRECLMIGERLGIGFLGLGFCADLAAQRHADHAQEALRGHDALYADGRRTWPRHDVSHRDDPGELGLRE